MEYDDALFQYVIEQGNDDDDEDELDQTWGGSRKGKSVTPAIGPTDVQDIPRSLVSRKQMNNLATV
jgi:hypothetical protein